LNVKSLTLRPMLRSFLMLLRYILNVTLTIMFNITFNITRGSASQISAIQNEISRKSYIELY
jgi:hypothetical protein